MSRAQLYVAIQFALFAALALALIIFPPGQTPLLRIMGLALIIVAFAVLALAVLEYRRANASLPNVTPTPDSQAGLVTSGIYARIRHPIYTAVLSGAFGVALAHGHWAAMAVALVMLPFFTAKSRYEETLLKAAYPQYETYMRHTGRFLPFS